MTIVKPLPEGGKNKDVIRKHSSVISATYVKNAEFRPEDVTFFNYLLMRTGYIVQPHGTYQIPIKDVMEFMKFDRPSKVHDCLDRLCRAQIEVDYVDKDGNPRSLRSHYLSHDSSRTETGFLKFAFDPIIVEFIIEPKVYGLISVNRSNDIKSYQGKKLYELTSLQRHKHDPVWRVSVDEFRTLISAEDKHPRFDNFRRNVIDKAVKEVNAVADYEVQYSVLTDGPGGKSTILEFKVVEASHSRLMASKLVKSTKAKRGRSDPHTVDMYDGLTNKERGGPAELTATAIEAASKLIPEDEDIEDYVAEWRDQNRGFSLLDPDRRFISFVELKMMHRNDPVLSALDEDLFQNLINEDDD